MERSREIRLLITLGVIVSGYLALCQLGIFSRVWDPIFGSEGSEAVLHSSLSRSLPVPDALLGCVAFLCELALLILLNHVAAKHVHRVEQLFHFLTAVMALVGIFLIFAQIFIIHAGCTLCLLSAVLSLFIWRMTWRHEAVLSPR